MSPVKVLSPDKLAKVEDKAVPFNVIASASNVPSMSAFPEISKVAASISPDAVRLVTPVTAPPKATLLLPSSKINLLAGNVQKTSLVPELKLTALSLLELDITVVLGVMVGNTTTGQITATVTLTSDTSNRAGANDEANQEVELVTNAPIPVGGTLELLSGNKVVMETTDVLKLTASGAADIAVSIMEIT